MSLAETLILSKLDCADLIFYPLPQFLLHHLQQIQFAAASFVLEGHYVKNFRMYLKSDGFQAMREEIWTSWNHALKLCITLRLGQIIVK